MKYQITLKLRKKQVQNGKSQKKEEGKIGWTKR